MGLRFNRRMKILPGVRLNFSKSGISWSFGTKGSWVTFGKNGTRTTFGIPGTGISYTEYSKKRKNKKQIGVYCPACNKFWPYHPAMENEELICTCKHRFYLQTSLNLNTQDKKFDVVGVTILLLIVAGLIFGIGSCCRHINNVNNMEKYNRSERYAKKHCEKEIWDWMKKNVPEETNKVRYENGRYNTIRFNTYFKRSEYCKDKHLWIMEGDFELKDLSKSLVKGCFKFEIFRVFLRRGEDTRLKSSEIKLINE